MLPIDNVLPMDNMDSSGEEFYDSGEDYDVIDLAGDPEDASDIVVDYENGFDTAGSEDGFSLEVDSDMEIEVVVDSEEEDISLDEVSEIDGCSIGENDSNQPSFFSLSPSSSSEDESESSDEGDDLAVKREWYQERSEHN